ncbi:MAG: LAGLIDADG family homing endonuclease [bacterium]
MWARKYKMCTKCGTTKVKHLSRGLCVKCYHKEAENRHKQHIRKHGIASKKLTKKFLIEQYLIAKRSLSEISIDCSCSRQYVYKKMRQYNLPSRNLRSARILALNQEKIKVEKVSNIGDTKTVIHRRIKYNQSFFSTWSNAMAYVLGILYTDGCLSMQIHHGKESTRRTPIISLAQKERELVGKVLSLLKCNARVHYRRRKIYDNSVSGSVYYFNITCSSIYPDLIRLGLKTTKSLDIAFPTIPKKYIRHFIRGCWDGDGSVYFEKGKRHLTASFYSGSRLFIEGMLSELARAALPKRTMYTLKRKHPSYYFKYHGSSCITLYHYLYDNVPPTQYLDRKHALFKKYADRQEEKSHQIAMFSRND